MSRLNSSANNDPQSRTRLQATVDDFGAKGGKVIGKKASDRDSKGKGVEESVSDVVIVGGACDRMNAKGYR